jgi:hypothetical protein
MKFALKSRHKLHAFFFLFWSVIFCLSFFSCSGFQNIAFKKTNQTFQAAKGEIIFLPGLYTEFEYKLIDILTKKANQIGPFTVVPFEDYKNKLNLSLAVPNGAATLELKDPQDYSGEIDMDKIRHLFKLFDKPYIFIVWIPQYFKQGSQSYSHQVTIIGRLYARDSLDNEIGFSHYAVNSGCLIGNMVSGNPEAYDEGAADLLEQAADLFIKGIRTEFQEN